MGKLPIAKDALKPTLKSLIMFAAYNLFFGLAPGIDNSAHLGGLAAGLGLGAVLAGSFSEPPEIRARRRNYVVVGTLLLFLLANNYLRHRAGQLQPNQSLMAPFGFFSHTDLASDLVWTGQARGAGQCAATRRVLQD
jgi:hypothetical protein